MKIFKVFACAGLLAAGIAGAMTAPVLAQEAATPAAAAATAPTETDVEKAARYKTGAEAGDALAMFNLAVMYEDGRGLAKDTDQAVYWYQRSADGGDPGAVYTLGIFYLDGTYVAKDVDRALGLILTAAKAGYPDAQYELADIYYYGDKGVAQDRVKGYAWALLAEQGGSEAAMELLDTEAYEPAMTEAQITEANELSKTLVPAG